MTAPPLVSVVVPVFNGARHLAETLESAVAQTWRPLEVIVVDDGSIDASVEIARGYDVRVLLQANRGVAVARNAGAAAARAEFISFLDQDDVWLPEKIAEQMDLLLGDGGADFSLTLQERFVDGVRPAWVRPEWIGTPLPAYEPSTLLTRRSTWERVGPFDERYRQASDADWFFRASTAGCRIAWVRRALTRRRMHEGSNSRFVNETAADLRRIALETIRGRRRAEST